VRASLKGVPQERKRVKNKRKGKDKGYQETFHPGGVQTPLKKTGGPIKRGESAVIVKNRFGKRGRQERKSGGINFVYSRLERPRWN